MPAPRSRSARALAAPISRRTCLGAALGLLGTATGSAWGQAAGVTLAQGAASPAWPTQIRLDFEVSGRYGALPVHASGRLHWDGLETGHYDATWALRIPLLGGRTQRSRGRLLPEGLQPLEFSDQTRRLRRLELDWPAMHYRHWRDGKVERSGPLQSGAQDQLSLQFQLAWLMHQGQVRAETVWTLPVLSAAGVEPWRMRVRANETIETPAGSINAWKIERQTKAPEESRLSLWLAERLHYLPARILLQEPDGDWADQRLKQWPRA